jgi:hypothetical protein
MDESSALHTGIVSLITLTAAVAARNGELYACHRERLRKMGVPEAHIATAVEIARHARDEASAAFDRELSDTPATTDGEQEAACCSGGACC